MNTSATHGSPLASLSPLKHAALLCAILLVGSMSRSIAAAPEPRWFSIELIVFEQFLNPSYAENWPHQPVLEFPENLVRFPSESRNNSQPDLFSELAFSGQLEQAKAKLERARGQRVLFSRRWEQGILNKENAPYIYLRGGESSGSHRELEGSIQISVERYLHVKANLWLSKFMEGNPPSAIRSTISMDGDPLAEEYDSSFEEPLERIVLPEIPFKTFQSYQQHGPIESVYLLKQERRLRSRETHYIDHPAMGIILRIEPLPDRNVQE